MRVVFIVYVVLVTAVLMTTLIYYMVNHVRGEKNSDEEK